MEEKAWRDPPFAGLVHDGSVWGRGAADDKGPLVQTLLALKALRETKARRTHTVRLLVGSDEESGSTDLPTYLKDHKAPDYSLVIDAIFPVVVGEKGWNALRVSVDPKAGTPSGAAPWEIVDLDAGLAPSIVPDTARVTLRPRGDRDNAAFLARLRARTPLPTCGSTSRRKTATSCWRCTAAPPTPA